ncbi:flagellar hook-length control protein FliK [Brenneria goodwinii]|uniref:flagellar hook-length control protein FliK n=1 Tax=Brenneria goodwinii TaxID=1109412 RepID=UPI0036F0E72E
MNLSTVTMITTNNSASATPSIANSERADASSQGQSFDRVLASTMTGNQQTELKKEQAPAKNAQQTTDNAIDSEESQDVAQSGGAMETVLQDTAAENIAFHKNPKLTTNEDGTTENAAGELAFFTGALPVENKLPASVDIADADSTLTNINDTTRQLMSMIQTSQQPAATSTNTVSGTTDEPAIIPAIIPAIVTALPQTKASTTDKNSLLSDSAAQNTQPATTSSSVSSVSQFAQRLSDQSDDAVSLANSNKAAQQVNTLTADAEDKPSFTSTLTNLRDGQSVAAQTSTTSVVQHPASMSAQAPIIQTSASVAPVATAQINAQLGSDEWQQAVSQQVIMFSRNGQQSAELRLHPQELGALQISLKLDDNQAQLHLMSANSQVRAAMEAALPHLRTSMAESGINLGQASVGSEASPGWQQQAQQQSESQRNTGQGRLNDGVELSATTLAQSSLVANTAALPGGVDIFA